MQYGVLCAALLFVSYQELNRSEHVDSCFLFTFIKNSSCGNVRLYQSGSVKTLHKRCNIIFRETVDPIGLNSRRNLQSVSTQL
jgi:hypothetical protein